MNAKEWLSAYAQKLGTDAPSSEDMRQLLDLSAEAAHSSERIAAPIACWLAARADIPLDEARKRAQEVVSDG